MAKQKIPSCPVKLKTANAKKLWASVHHEFLLEAESDLLTLAQACTCIDRLAEASKRLDHDGVTFLDRFDFPKEHPAVEIWCKFSRQYLRAMRELGIGLEAEQYLRAPGVRTSGRRKAG